MSLKFDFSNHSFLITGGARGIGLEIALAFLESGARVAIWDFSTESLESARRILSAHSARIHFQTVDITSDASINDAVRSLPFDIHGLINNAGITRDKSFSKMTAADFDSVISTNLRGVFLVTQSLLNRFAFSETEPQPTGARIVNIASVVALYGNFGQSNYVASKAGVIGLTKTWARELARKGFTVNAIAPGFIETPMTDAMPADALSAMKNKIPVGRLGTPRDIANACLFLASDEASYINGITLSVDGALVV